MRGKIKIIKKCFDLDGPDIVKNNVPIEAVRPDQFTHIISTTLIQKMSVDEIIDKFGEFLTDKDIESVKRIKQKHNESRR